MPSLAAFGAGLLMRPIGALVLGGYIDRHGRRKGMILTLGGAELGGVSVYLSEIATPGWRDFYVA